MAGGLKYGRVGLVPVTQPTLHPHLAQTLALGQGGHGCCAATCWVLLLLPQGSGPHMPGAHHSGNPSRHCYTEKYPSSQGRSLPHHPSTYTGSSSSVRPRQVGTHRISVATAPGPSPSPALGLGHVPAAPLGVSALSPPPSPAPVGSSTRVPAHRALRVVDARVIGGPVRWKQP